MATTHSARDLSPLNDFARYVYIEDVDPTTGEKTPATDGEVTGFLASSDSSSATAADASWSVSGVHVGVAGSADLPLGTWLLVIDADDLQPGDVSTAFTANIAYFIITRAGAARVVERVTVRDARYL